MTNNIHHHSNFNGETNCNHVNCKKYKSVFLFTLILSLLFLCSNTISFADIPSALSKAGPVIQLVEYSITEGNVELDSQFTIEVTLKNNNAYSAAYNVIATADTPDMAFHLVNGQVNQTYFQSISPNDSVTFSQTFYIDKTFPYNSAFLTYSFTYYDENGNKYTNSTSLSPKVTIPCTLKINVLSVASTASLGSRSLVNVRCTNDGTIDISSIEMHLSGDIMDSQTVFELGSLKSGEQLMKDCYVNFTKYGQQALKISFTYKDDDGNTYSIAENTYSVNVTSEKSSSVDSASSSGGNMVIGGKSIRPGYFIIVIIITVAAVYFIRRLLKSMKTTKKGK